MLERVFCTLVDCRLGRQEGEGKSQMASPNWVKKLVESKAGVVVQVLFSFVLVYADEKI